MSAILTIDAIFEDGVFVPKGPFRTLPNHQRVKLNIWVDAEDGDFRLPDGPILDTCISAPFDLPRYGESRIVECVFVEEREMDAATIAELQEVQSGCLDD